jgi:hypothetical protein
MTERSGHWQRWRAWTPSERRFLLRALLELPLLHWQLRRLGMARSRAWLAKRRLPDLRGTLAPRSIAALIHTAGRRGVARGTCLSRSLLLEALLRQAGYRPVLRIGVRREASRVEAHAWLELDGTVVNDAPEVRERFQLLDLGSAEHLRFPPTRD